VIKSSEEAFITIIDPKTLFPSQLFILWKRKNPVKLQGLSNNKQTLMGVIQLFNYLLLVLFLFPSGIIAKAKE
jgi:hypothetical protein